MDKDILKKIRAGNFVENNGRVLRTINIIRYNFIQLKGLRHALPDMLESEILDSVNFLSEEGYISLRRVTGHIESTLADADFRELEAKLTGKGIRLLSFEIKDPSVAV
ncbi:hypothetical protein FACS189425_03530 [Clostridia bacterium]|nr:hypothetical protein FACS189425_03530 [Clostridia bacterium]